MKTTAFKTIVLIYTLSLSAIQANCQFPAAFIRGHNSDDLYIHTASEDPFNGYYLFYLTENGSIVTMQNSNWIFGRITAETIPGKLIDFTPENWLYSIDYGKNFSGGSGYVNYYTSFDYLFGGEIPGEYMTQGSDISLNPYPLSYVIYKTTDYGLHYTFIADSVGEIINGEPGHISGEFYQMPLLNGHAFLCRSLDFGATFDSIPVDTNVINVNTGLNFGELSRGKQPGELFLVSKTVVSASEIHYSIYHTSDYGHTWVLKSTKVFDSERQKFTGGRAACSFYMANLKTTPNSTYYTLQIYYSADCGETFTLYEHMLTPDVGLSDKAKSDGRLCISPNPAKDLITLAYTVKIAGKVTMRLYSSDGKQADMLLSEQQDPGTHSLKYPCGQLKPGMYSIGMTDASGKTVSGKFIVGR
jgi:hypothetical protein